MLFCIASSSSVLWRHRRYGWERQLRFLKTTAVKLSSVKFLSWIHAWASAVGNPGKRNFPSSRNLRFDSSRKRLGTLTKMQISWKSTIFLICSTRMMLRWWVKVTSWQNLPSQHAETWSLWWHWLCTVCTLLCQSWTWRKTKLKSSPCSEGSYHLSQPVHTLPLTLKDFINLPNKYIAC